MAEQQTQREAVGIFDDMDGMQEAIADLEVSGFGRRHISVLGSDKAMHEHFGESNVATGRLEDSPEAPRAPNIKREELYVGQGVLIGGGILTGVAAALVTGGVALPIAAMTTAVVASGVSGGAIGAILAKLMGDKYASFFQQQISEGGLLLWVITATPEMEEKAQAILKKHGARDVHMHTLPVETKTAETFSAEAFKPLLSELQQLQHTHATLLSADETMAEKLMDITTLLEASAGEPHAVSRGDTIPLDEKIKEAAAYAKDMGENEQQIIAESPATGTGKQERESPRYFKLAEDLTALRSHYLGEVMDETEAAA